MNLGVFNRVNLKDSTSGGMYSEWASLTNVIQNKSDDYSSVLNKLPIGSGRDVTLAVVKQLASNLGISQPAEPSPLVTDKEVQWCMEVNYCCMYIFLSVNLVNARNHLECLSSLSWTKSSFIRT
uniref:Ral GTPase-activating protein subunit beta n=1 Tax=Cacopsylla melanoneura TaxID=428564 RepID=A0A8D8PUC5_9HEMI